MQHSILRQFFPLALGILVVCGGSRIGLEGYATSGHTWGTNQVLYYINPQNKYMSDTAAILAIQKGASPWSAQTLANIQLVYAGYTGGSSLTLNRKNEVFFRNDSSGYIAETYWWYDGTGHLVDADMVFHQSTQFFTESGCSAGVYLEDSAVHEFGHALGLEHSSVSNATMAPAMPSYCDLTQLSLESDDIAGIESLYPPASSKPKNTAPTVTISAPANSSSFANGATILFSASANDSQDGNLTSSLSWTSSIDGVIGSGGSFSRTLSAGTHGITASSRDSGGLLGSSQVTVTVAAASAATGPSPDGTTVPVTATQIVDNGGAIWTIGSNQAILRNGVQAGGGWGSQILWKSATIYVFGTDTNWWQWMGSSWSKIGATSGQLTSPDGTTVPVTATQIVDNGGAIWTIGSNQAILRNGVQAGGGWGSQIIWKSATIYVFGTDSNWWQWMGSSWSKIGATSGQLTSPDGTTVPITATQIVDNNGAIWTIGSNQAILRNGVQAGGGWGFQILWKSATIYVFGTDGNWWQWTGSSWIKIGPVQP